MLFKALSAAVFGIDAYPVEVEVDISAGLPNFTTVGLPDAAVRESRERIKSAIKNCGLEFPFQNIIVNLAENAAAPESAKRANTSSAVRTGPDK
jgi:magnesium chelatase family protein